MKIVFFNTINIPQKIPAMHFLSGQSIQRSDPSFAAAFHKLVHLRSRLFPAKQKGGNHLFIKRHPTTSIDFNFYFLFLGFGAGNSSYMALNRPVKNCLLTAFLLLLHKAIHKKLSAYRKSLSLQV